MEKIMENFSEIKIIECPRDAMQGWKVWIPTGQKVKYIKSLLNIGFDTIDFGSFVSEKAIPQMKDTHAVIKELNVSEYATKLLAIVANERGASEASLYEQITYIGFPFSVSETFQIKNTNKTIDSGLQMVDKIQDICLRTGKKLVIYISMGFGNPYGDTYNEEIVLGYIDKFAKMQVEIVSIADTVGMCTPHQITSIFSKLIPTYNKVEFGVHLHSTPEKQEEKILAALGAGCNRFDGAIKGIGGCPMANDVLVGNINTEQMLDTFKKVNRMPLINYKELLNATIIADGIFSLE